MFVDKEIISTIVSNRVDGEIKSKKYFFGVCTEIYV